jgi:dolichol kinase
VRLSKEEISRKLLHLFALLMPVSIYYGPEWSFPGFLVPLILGTLFVLSVIIEFLRFKSPAVQSFFFKIFLFILGDAMAALVGISIGRTKIGKKSLEGSLACFVTCLALFYLVFPLFPGLLDAWNHRLPHGIVLVTALVITVFELIPLKVHPKIVINDNLAVPIIAGYVIKGLELLHIS